MRGRRPVAAAVVGAYLVAAGIGIALQLGTAGDQADAVQTAVIIAALGLFAALGAAVAALASRGAWAAAVGIALLTVGLTIGALSVGVGHVIETVERTGAFAPSGIGRVLSEAGNALNFGVFVAAVVSLFLRRRRAGPVERRQLKWFAYGTALFAGSILIPWPEPLAYLLELGSVAFLPVAVGIAITRYRLYEIDRIISRTATYALVTAVLVGVYALVAVVPSVVLDVESDLLVAAATLAAAGLFVPVRRRVQATVDRRFNRARYDARRVVERFESRVRDQVDVDSVSDNLAGAVATAVQPAQLSVWVRHTEPAP